MTILRATIHLLRHSLARFADMAGVDRAMGLAAQGFTALFPLLIVVAAVLQDGEGGSLGNRIVEKFDLTGDAATAAQRAFPESGTVEQSVSVLSALLLLISALAFARALERMYEQAWNLEARGWRDTPYGLAWLATLCGYFVLHPLLHGHLSHELGLAFSIAGSFALWLVTPYILLGRRLPWRALVPQAVLAAVGMTALRAGSAIYLPRAIASASEQFGTIGFAFTLVSWLFAAGLVLTATAACGACFAEARDRSRQIIRLG